jgi:hypothetical protein
MGEVRNSCNKGRDHLDNVRTDLKECGKLWTGFIWLRIGTNGGLL